MEGGFTVLEHPSDIGIEARGTTLAEAFENAARGLTALILDPAAIEPRETRAVEVDATDREQLLVRWLSEILYLFDGEHLAVSDCAVRTLTSSHLRAILRVEPFVSGKHPTRTDVKAVTYHQLLIDEGSHGATIRFFVDI